MKTTDWWRFCLFPTLSFVNTITKQMKVAIIDNYDSFTYNLSHLVKELGAEVTVLRNDAFEMEELENYDKLVFSPGPGLPREAGKLEEVIRTYAGKKPMLGVCLGEQAIGEVFGSRLKNLDTVFHGVQSSVRIYDAKCIFEGLPNTVKVGRYHSWVVDAVNFPKDLLITARSSEGYIMAIRHQKYDIYGIQFHPESILTPDGKQMISNFLYH